MEWRKDIRCSQQNGSDRVSLPEPEGRSVAKGKTMSLRSLICIRSSGYLPLLLGLVTLGGGLVAAEDGWVQLRRRMLDSLATGRSERVEEVRLVLDGALYHTGNRLRYNCDRRGIEHRNLHLVLRREAGEWHGGEVVDLGPSLERRFVLHGVDASDLELADGRLRGEVRVTSSRSRFRNDMHGAIVYHHIPATDIPVPEWRLGGAYRARPFTMAYRLDIDLADDSAWSLRLRLPRGLRLPQKERSDAEIERIAEREANAKVARKRKRGSDVEVGDAYWRKYRREVLSILKRKRDGLRAKRYRAVTLVTRWHADGTSAGWATARRYNRAFHQVDPGDLRVVDGRLVGDLRVRYNPDPWVSPPGGGAQWQTYRFDMDVQDGGRLTGEVAAAGIFGSYATPVHGTLARLAVGGYSGDGPDGACGGAAHAERRGLPLGLPDVPPETAADRLRELDTCLVLHQRPGYAYPELLRERDPTFLGAEALVGELLPALRRHVEHAPSAPTSGSGPLGASEHGPYVEASRPLAADAELPADGWHHPSTWRWLGPCPDAGVPPFLQAVATTEAHLSVADRTHAWTSTKIDGPHFLPGPVAAGVRENRVAEFNWYCTTEIAVPASGRYLLALPAHQNGACWLDGILVWRGAERHDALDTAVFPLELDAGRHRVVLRAGMSGLNWKRGMGGVSSRSGEARLAFAATGLRLRRAPVEPEPEPEPEPKPEPEPEPDPIVVPPVDAELSSRGVPVAWSLATGTNCRWRRSLPAGARTPVLVGDACVVDAPGAVTCVELADGTERWRVELAGAPVGLSAMEDAVCTVTDQGAVRLLEAADGTLRWRRTMTPPDPGGGRILEAVVHPPTVLGDAVVLAWRLKLRPAEESGSPRAATAYRCLDLADGSERWSLIRPGSVPAMRAMELHRGEDRRTVWISSQADVIDPASGELLHEGLLQVPAEGIAPTVADQMAIFSASDYDLWLGGWTSGHKAAIRVWLTRDGRVGARHLWRSRGPSHYPGPPPVVDGDLFYLSRTNNGHHQEGPAPLTRLHVYDRVSGSLLAELSPMLHGNTAPKGLRLVNGRLYAADEGGDQYFNNGSKPRMAVVAPGLQPLILAINQLPQGKIPPLYAEDCMVVAGEGELICLAVDEADGIRWQADMVARKVIQTLRSRPVDPETLVHRPEPIPPGTASRLPIWRFRHQSVPERMLRIGPFPLVAEDSAWLPALEEPLAIAERGLVVAGQRHAAEEPPAGTIRFGGTVWAPFDNAWGHTARWTIDGWKALDNRQDSRVVLLSTVEIAEAGTYRLQVGSRGVRVGVAGTLVAANDLVKFRPGRYPLAIGFGIGEIPAQLRGRRINVPVSFRRQLPLAERQRRWRERVLAARPVIEELLGILAEDSPMRPVLKVMLKSAMGQ